MNIGERIKQFRKNRGLTQIKLSELLQISPITVRRWEWGERKPDIDIMPKLADTLNTSVNDLMGLRDTEKQPNTSKEITSLMEKVADENTNIETPITVGTRNDMYIIKDGVREYLIPNDEEGRKLFLDFLRSSLTGMGIYETSQMVKQEINNGTHSSYNNSTVNNETPTIATSETVPT